MEKLMVSSIVKLEGEKNWASWKFDIDLQLSVNKVKSIVTGELIAPEELGAEAEDEERRNFMLNKKKFDEADAIVRFVIGTSCVPEVKQHILTCKSGKEMWEVLHSIYEQRNERRLDLLYTQLFGYQKDRNDDIATHVSKLQRIWQDLQEELKGENVCLPKSMLLNRILNTLPNDYLEFKNAWESVPSDSRDIPNLLERLRLHEQRLKETHGNENNNSNSVALVANSKNYKPPTKVNKSDGNTKKNITCFYCGKRNHYKKDCWKFKSDNNKKEEKSKYEFEKSNKKEDKLGQVYLTITNNFEDNTWLIDSGASHHICSRLDWFSTYSSFPVAKSLRIGNGSQMFALGEGEIKVETMVDGKWNPGTLTKVWYVPESAENLFSAGSALDNGLIEIADSRRREFQDKNGYTVAVGFRQCFGIYKLRIRVILKPPVACLVDDEIDELQIWHERLCHQNKQHVQKLLKQQGITLKQSSDRFCNACMFGKMHRLSFGNRPNRPTKAAELIHSDVCGPMPVTSFGGNRYFVTFKDDFSKYRRIYFMTGKHEVKEKLKIFLAEVKNAEYIIKQWLTDGGKEFDNQEIHKITEEIGLEHRMSMPYTPEQNGGSERENRILVEAARTMLYASPHLPEELWAEAVNTAAYVLNRTGNTSILGKSPFEVWFNKKPNFDHFKIFGTECFVHIPKQRRKKFDAKAKRGYFVGYCSNKDGYRVFIPEEKNVIISRDVVFKNEKVSSLISKMIDTSLNNDKEKEINEIQTVSSVGEDVEENEETAEEPKFQEEINEGNHEVIENIEEITEENNEVSKEVEVQQEIINELEIHNDEVFDRRTSLRDRKCLRKPIKYEDFAMDVLEEPITLTQAMSSEDSSSWKQAMEEELKSLAENQVYKLVKLPPGRKVIDNRWVFKIKYKSDNTIDRYKARLVVKGYSQKYGLDFIETFSPVVRWDTIRSCLSIAANERLKISQFDVKTAFLYGELNEEIYMKQPEGFNDGSGRVCKLLKSLYGLKQAPRCWNKKIKSFFEECRLIQSETDPCLFIRKDGYLFVLLYVDDGLVFSKSDHTLQEFMQKLKKNFSITINPPNYFLGLEIQYLKDGSIFIKQETYVKKLLNKFNMLDANPVTIPMNSCEFPVEVSEKLKMKDVPFREIIGSLLYLAVVSRPDIAFSITWLSQFLEKWEIQHWNMAKKILRYLKGTFNMGILYKSQKEFGILEAFSDSDYAGDAVTRKSTSGMVFKYGNGAITWSSKRQNCIALSTTEAEFIAASQTAKEAIWIKRLFEELIGKEIIPCLQIDNQSAIRLIKNPEFHNRSKHIDVRYKFVREKYQEEVLDIKYVTSENQVADIFTKALPKKRFEDLRILLGLIEYKKLD